MIDQLHRPDQAVQLQEKDDRQDSQQRQRQQDNLRQCTPNRSGLIATCCAMLR
jgi:hypothetical protein